jgi:hypothetical protein
MKAASMTLPDNPAASPNPIDAFLDEAQETLVAAFATHEVAMVVARAERDGDSFRISDFKAFRTGGDIVDLAVPRAIVSGSGPVHRTYASLQELAEDYIATTLGHRPQPFCTDGDVTLHAGGHVAQPIDWSARQVHETEELKKALHDDKQPILAALKAIGAAVVTITYDGEGDSGQIDDITAHTTDNTEVNLDVPFVGPAANSSTLRNAIDDLAWQCLQALHDGFENNEGGCGEIIIDVATGGITVDHNDRIVELNNTVTEL